MHLVQAGLMTEGEMRKVEVLEETVGGRHQVAWAPISWAHDALRRAMPISRNGNFEAQLLYKTLHDDLTDCAWKAAILIGYSWVSIPLVYTQLVTSAVYIYFFFSLFSGQYLSPARYL